MKFALAGAFVLAILAASFPIPSAYASSHPLLVMSVEREAYAPGEEVKITLDVVGSSAGKIEGIVQVYEEGYNTVIDEKKEYGGEPLEFTYAPGDSVGWSYVVGYLQVDGNMVDKKDAIIYSTLTSDSMRITDFRMDKNAFQPREPISFTSRLLDAQGAAIAPADGYMMFCDATDSCYAPFTAWSDEDGNFVGQGEVPLELQGSYKLVVWALPPTGTDYRPTKYETDITVHGEPYPVWTCVTESPRLCYDPSTEVISDRSAGDLYELKLQVEPQGPLQVKIFNQRSELLFSETLYGDESGSIDFKYEIPDDAPIGHYFVQLYTWDIEGKSYYSFVYHLGGRYPWGGVIDPGEMLFRLLAQYQEGAADDQYDRPYVLGSPVNVKVETATPPPDRQTLPDQPVELELVGPDGEVIDNRSMQSGPDGIVEYSFTPTDIGYYRLKMTTEHDGLQDILSRKFPAGMENNFSVTAEGKTFPVLLENDWYYSTWIRGIEFDQREKRLSVDIGNLDMYNNVAVRIPYELLHDITVFTNGELVGNDNVSKDMDSAVFHVPVDDSVTRIDFVGTSAIPEFPLAASVLASGFASLLALYKLKTSRRH